MVLLLNSLHNERNSNPNIFFHFKDDEGSVERNVTVNVPKSAVEGSARVYLTGTADLLGPAMNNLVNLIRYGYARNIYILFLPASARQKPVRERQAHSSSSGDMFGLLFDSQPFMLCYALLNYAVLLCYK